MRYQGRICQWLDDKGYGFIAPNGGGEPVFVHVSAFVRRRQRPQGNERVTYELGRDGKGRTQAREVAFVGEARPEPAFAGGLLQAPLLGGAFLLFVALMALKGRLPHGVLLLYLICSLIAYGAYWIDKSAAKANRWRTPESTLHFWSLIGGWPGALLAQRRLRHKSAKPAFLAIYWLTVLLNCGALGWLLSPSGSRLLRSFA